MAHRAFHDLAEFTAAIRNSDYDRYVWVDNTENYKEVRCMWLCGGEYDGGETLIYLKPTNKT